MVNPLGIAEAWANVGKSAFGGQNAFEAGRSKMAQALAEQALREAQGRNFEASAAKNQAEADNIRQRNQYQTPEFSSRIAAGMAGLSDTQGADLEAFQKAGNWGVNPAYADDARQMTVAPTPKAAPEWYSPELEKRFNMGRGAHLANLGATGDTNADQMIKGFAELLARGDYDASKDSPEALLKYAQRQYAQKGSAPFSQDATGVLNVLEGNFTAKPEWQTVQRSIADENNAQASNAYASAGAHNASRQKTLAEIPEVQSRIDLNRSKIGQPTVNPDGSVTAPTGKPIKLSSAAEKELFEADDGIQAGKNVIGILKSALDINKKAYSGYGAKFRADVRSNLPGQSESADATINLDNMMTGQALESLKSIFGGMPTEGERKILLDMQASADKTPKQREEIINRAIKSAEKRVIFNTNKAKALRSGTYNIADPQAQGQEPSIDDLLKKYGG